MKIIRHTARDMRQALRAVREQLGEDAVILSSRRTGEGVEVTAAVDFDASTLEAGGFSGTPAATALPPAAVGPAPAAALPPPAQERSSVAALSPTALALTTGRAPRTNRTEAAATFQQVAAEGGWGFAQVAARGGWGFAGMVLNYPGAAVFPHHV